MIRLPVIALLSLFVIESYGGEKDALNISRRIQAYHTPHGVVAETKFVSPQSSEMERIYDGDGAIWTGHYLAAEVYHYAVTGSAEALANVRRTLTTVEDLAYVSGTGLLARTIFPVNSPYKKDDPKQKDWRQINYKGEDIYYVDYVTRDQYVGVFLGLWLAYDLVNDADIRARAGAVITRLTEYLISKKWILYNPDAQKPLETFIGRWDHMLAVLQIAKHVDPSRFAGEYEKVRKAWSWTLAIPIYFERYSPSGKYYRFNLDYGYFFALISLESDPGIRAGYMKTYTLLREFSRPHINAHFNMIDFVLNGADAGRDQETRDALSALLVRGFRDYPVDLRPKYKECSPNVSCTVIPVVERPYHDFMWQRSPYELYNGTDGSVEAPGIDYILPYWMARYYGVQAAD